MQYFITFVFEKGLKAVNDYLVERMEKKMSTKQFVLNKICSHLTRNTTRDEDD